MAEIRIEGKTALAFGDHLYLVFVDDSGAEFVIRGGPASDNPLALGNIVTESGVPIAASEDFRPIEDRADFGSTVIDLGGRDAEDVWETMKRASILINEANINYDITGPNSNSAVASVLHAVGIDANAIQPDLPGIDFFPGISDNLLDDYAREFTKDHTSSNDDILRGGNLDDRFEGGGGDDDMDGGDGTDTVVLAGDPTDYDIRLNTDGTWTSRHVRGDADEGTDTFTDLESVEFGGGQTFDLENNGLTFQTDFAFVVDQTGSMFDDIDAVKASATAVVDALFAGDAIDARIGVVGFRDNTIGEPTQVVLPFTDQDDFADRKAAAIAAINSLSASGGGDFEETAFDGLLKALDGSMGDWREGAATKRLALFTDAAAKDDFLQPTVLGFAQDIGAVISGSSAQALGTLGSVDTFELSFDGAIASDDVTPPGGKATVQIFTIFIDTFITPDPNLVEVSEASGGGVLTAANPTEVVERLLEVISGGNAAPVAVDDAFSIGEDQLLSGNVLADNGSGADFDPDAGDTLTATLVSGPSEGVLTLNPDGTFTYDADADAFDLMVPGTSTDQMFVYQVSDGNGGSAQATATIEVAIRDDGESFSGTDDPDEILGTDGGEDLLTGNNGSDRLHGLDGADHLYGNNGNDHLYGGESVDRVFGGDGDDTLFGDQGDDFLYGERGNDTSTGGDGADQFWFEQAGGTDTITDFEIGQDLIVFSGLNNVSTFADLHSSQDGERALLGFAGGNIILEGTDASGLTESDFMFV